MTDVEKCFSRLLPGPKAIAPFAGAVQLQATAEARILVTDERIEGAIRQWLAELPRNAPTPSVGVRVAIDAAVSPPDGYRLLISPEGIELVGQSSAGCFYGLQTLRQLVGSAGEAPCCEIRDWPDFATRGLLHDVSRGKVPTLATLKRLVDRLAGWKCNQLQLYIEHAFTFEFDRSICGPDDGVTPDEVRELDGYCKDRFIDLVPAVATFGHMGRILSLPQYRRLAEIEAQESWADMSWPARARGLTLDVLNPDSHQLVAQIWREILAAFSSPVVNLCGDEPWDLGKGKNKSRLASREAIGRAYLEHIARTHAICAAGGRATQAWSDVVKNYSELFGLVPKGMTILHWGYDDQADSEGTGKFVEAGLPTICCPGTSGWKRILNAMNLAERNISTFAAAGRKHQAQGLLNTDWGDHGHFNSLACSWHAIALGAALGWSADHPTGQEFDRRFSGQAFGDGSEVIAELREASRIADKCETWGLLWMPLREVVEDRMLPAMDLVDRCAGAAMSAYDGLEELKPDSGLDEADLSELRLACRAMQVFAEKMAAAHRLRAKSAGLHGRTVRESHFQGAEFAEIASALAHDYGEVWRRRNKLSGLWDVLGALARVSSEFMAAGDDD